MTNVHVFFLYLQVGAPVRRREDPPPGTASRHHCFGLVWARLLGRGVGGEQISGGPTTHCRGHI